MPPLESGGIEGGQGEDASTFLEQNRNLLNLEVIWKTGNEDALCVTITVVELYKIKSDKEAGVTVAYHNGASQIWNFEPDTHRGAGKIKDGKLSFRMGSRIRVEIEPDDSGLRATWYGRQKVPGTVRSLPSGLAES